MKKTGYKEMLRDRCPAVVDCALKWQKAKERWIEHAYTRFICIYLDSKERYNATRIILGLSKKNRNFEFDKSVDWDNLSYEEKVYWKRVSLWVNWFQENYAYIENAYETSRKVGKDEYNIKVELIRDYLSDFLPDKHESKEVKTAKYNYVDKFVNYLISCFEGKPKKGI